MRILPVFLLAVSFTLPVSAGGGDSAIVLSPEVAQYRYDAVPKDPLASAFFSATIPGTGQIYNKEYRRGIITAAGFYAGFYAVQYLMARWEAINTDTLYFRETDAYGDWYGQVREVYVMRPENRQVGLPDGQKAALGVALAATAVFWVFGVVDAFKGAERYNNKLNAVGLYDRPVTVALDYNPNNNRVGLKTRLKF